MRPEMKSKPKPLIRWIEVVMNCSSSNLAFTGGRRMASTFDGCGLVLEEDETEEALRF